jgi:hypothetical protein
MRWNIRKIARYCLVVIYFHLLISLYVRPLFLVFVLSRSSLTH